jgi:hypothetical protein
VGTVSYIPGRSWEQLKDMFWQAENVRHLHLQNYETEKYKPVSNVEEGQRIRGIEDAVTFVRAKDLRSQELTDGNVSFEYYYPRVVIQQTELL